MWTLYSVALLQPTDLADGRYKCRVETLDSHGVLHMYLSTSQDGTLISLCELILEPVSYRAELPNSRFKYICYHYCDWLVSRFGLAVRR